MLERNFPDLRLFSGHWISVESRGPKAEHEHFELYNHLDYRCEEIMKLLIENKYFLKYLMKLTMTLNNHCEWPIACRHQFVHHKVQENRLNLAEEKHELKAKIFLRQSEACIMRSHHPNSEIESPNSSKNSDGDKWDEVENDLVEI